MGLQGDTKCTWNSGLEMMVTCSKVGSQSMMLRDVILFLECIGLIIVTENRVSTTA